ncbi:uncharacterized protein LOC125760239, partial [Rhipicephalus sanguineus]|uniref:uncharacterized protein LOC125760239 n=1 Tax=Rhipicephalus sanguineus TaxID=34632 RepID=UPI0020C5108A
TQLLVTKLHALLASGVDVSLHWVPSHVGIQGNEQADALAKEACPALQAQRAALLAALRRQGIPVATQRDLLFPAKHHTQVFKAVLRFLEDTGLANRL